MAERRKKGKMSRKRKKGLHGKEQRGVFQNPEGKGGSGRPTKRRRDFLQPGQKRRMREKKGGDVLPHLR